MRIVLGLTAGPAASLKIFHFRTNLTGVTLLRGMIKGVDLPEQLNIDTSEVNNNVPKASLDCLKHPVPTIQIRGNSAINILKSNCFCDISGHRKTVSSLPTPDALSSCSSLAPSSLRS